MKQIKTEKEFNAEIKANKFVLLDFFTTWCPPCKQVAKLFDKISEKYESKVVFLKFDGDDETKESEDDFPSKHRVDAFPTILLFQDGVEKHRIIGCNERAIINALNSSLV